MTYRFNCLGSETFGDKWWAKIRLYKQHEIRVPTSVPTTVSAMRGMLDSELFVLWVLSQLVSTWRGQDVNGWPKWALDVSNDKSKLSPQVLFDEICERIRLKYDIDVTDWSAAPILGTEYIMVQPADALARQHKVAEYINDKCEFTEEPWLK